MRKGSLALFLAWSLVFSFSFFTPLLHAAVQENVDYEVLAKPIPNIGNTVLEVFSYDCIFCYKYDKTVIPNLEKMLAKDGIRLSPWHLKARGRYGTQASELFAALISKDSKAGLSLFDDRASFKKAKFGYYSAYHDARERWDRGPETFLQTGLDAAGITRAEFQKLLKEPATQARLKDWDGASDIARVRGVPAFVVKGKYLLYNKNLKSTGDMAAKIRELMAK
ncbi:MAG: Thiol:disulfide interchange protein DsbL precursor [Syntrophus sp. PtaU1.Bin208]|nr:MAG: Thiol:disulfide interchange protein DsbL precursor [Syntrophus sp. PtaU1.Bin208]